MSVDVGAGRTASPCLVVPDVVSASWRRDARPRRRRRRRHHRRHRRHHHRDSRVVVWL